MAGRTVAVRLEARISAYQAAGPQDSHEAPTVGLRPAGAHYDGMEYITEADRLLAEQRQRHASYLRYIDREPAIMKDRSRTSAENPWDRTWVDELPTAPEDPGAEMERKLRSMADEYLGDDDRVLLEQFVGWVAASDAYQLMKGMGDSVGRYNVDQALFKFVAADPPDLRTQSILVAVDLMRLAEKLAG
jgi:hypothetical protein